MNLNGRHLCLITGGQSLSMGLQSTAISTSESYQNIVRIAGSSVGYTGSQSEYGNPGLATAQYESLIATARETIDYAMARGLHVFSDAWTPKTVIINGGLNGAGYLATAKGSQVYQETLARIRRAVELSAKEGASLMIAALNYISGETDHILFDPQGGAIGYEILMLELSANINKDYSAITRQAEVVKIIFCQTNAAPFYPIWAGNPTISSAPTTALIQAKLARERPDLFVMAGPRYHYAYSAPNDVHFSAEGYRQCGEKRSQIIRRILQDRTWKPLAPTKCSQVSETKIKIDFDVPFAPLVLDSSRVANPGSFGFQFIADRSNNAEIQSVTVADNSVILAFNKPPLGAKRSIGYAYSNFAVNPALVPGEYGAVSPENVGPLNGARGCLRDSDPYPSLFGYNHHNYCLQFIAPVT